MQQTRIRRLSTAWPLVLPLAWGVAGAAPRQDASPPGDERPTNPAAKVDPLVRPYLGTWMRSHEVEGRGTPVAVESYILMRWQRGRLRVKTVDYYPELKMRGRESDWNGEIRIDAWNSISQTFVPMPDGSISLGLSGSNGIGEASSNYWWAYGRITLEEDGKVLRLVTTDGYSPSNRGNAWRPFDHTYRKVSEELDPRFDPRPR